MQHLGVNFGGIWRFELGFFICAFWLFLLKKSGLIFKSPVATLPPAESLRHVLFTPNVQCQYLSVLIRDHVCIQTHRLIQLMNIISNLIFNCNNCDANRAFVTIRESTAAAQNSSLLNAKFTFKGTPHRLFSHG